MQVSYFETGRYYAPTNLSQQWPMPAGAYDREAWVPGALSCAPNSFAPFSDADRHRLIAGRR